MRKYIVIYIKGHAVFAPGGVAFNEQPGRHRVEVEAATKRDAYVAAAAHFAKLGLDVSVDRDITTKQNKLGFDDDDIQAIRNEKAPFITDYVTGVRIVAIVESI